MDNNNASRGNVDGLPSLDEFPAVSLADWEKMASAALKGASLARLAAKTRDGFTIEPLYASAPSALPIARAHAPWQISQRIDHPDIETAHGQALTDLENGANGLHLVLPNSQSAHGFGVPLNSPADYAHVLDGVELDLIELRVDPAGSGLAEAKALQAAVRSTRRIPSAMRIAFGCDPIGAMARGVAEFSDMDALTALAGQVHGQWGQSRTFSADGRVAHSAGASEAQELGYVLAAGVHYLRAMVGAGVPMEAARGQISFHLAADADQFLTIAKFRALRILWARVEEACGLIAAPIQVFAQSAWRMMTRTDPWVNILRANLGAFGAVMGGADVVSLLPFTLALGLPDALARRIARNAQLVLQAEAHLAVVADPTLGSGAFEALTSEMCTAGWHEFQQLEAQKGIVEALRSGDFAQNIAAVAHSRAQAIATRREPLTGTSEFAFIGQPEVAVLRASPLPIGMHSTASAHLAAHRLSEPFEALRLRADAMQPPPKVFLVNIGSLAEYGARNAFAKPFFAAGGIGFVEAPELASPVNTDGLNDLAKAAAASGAALACICGLDGAYTHDVEPIAKTLRGAGLSVFLAGRGGAHEAAWREAGIREFIHVGSNLLEIAEMALDICTPGRPS
ncbi:MAG: methylmalonyl-CoA mutase subunit beta [Hyphomicrobiales bacterium]|nr:methylmalonyl-CoA mutase subunit beta [Hyphomicrobiales bacterium]MDE2114342.1 methylmalonyl-CoA mutase small subunit [Hyphomicrobiales bacterium]